ncbi:L-histidine N(alpha)-methyltransferase [Sphingomonas sp. CARO-RG-8B-R24-01]|uniref:L-histidine N(alpha)-methyltransferase n=1 Tax=Sphingomonas sp. CARO-RG-8B-R24-01 TaxID=2914831 RepID=UPI001F578FCB|nr:L-histidine N(alpha)-methyltransferase [Sphingomonas sp. CARO-RG-8B-R24-01]
MTAAIAVQAAPNRSTFSADEVGVGAAQRESLRQDVVSGLSQRPKALPSRWLYDDVGSDLFEAITVLEEYYPTRTEMMILSDNRARIADFIGSGAAIIEYGAGSARKTEPLLASLDRPSAYVPVDIAGGFLESTVAALRLPYPVLPVVADFTQDFRLPDLPHKARRVAFFPGSTIGNLDRIEARLLLQRMHRQVGIGGGAVIGVDLIKDVDILIPAYDDAAGVTEAFNLNYLWRINRELGADFQPERFRHRAQWNVREQAVEMHLVSTDAQTVSIDGRGFRFAAGETIHTESSRKYDAAGIQRLADDSGWKVGEIWTDDASLFAVVGLIAA